MRLRQSLKVVKAGYLFCLAAEVVIAAVWMAQPLAGIPFWAPMLIPLVLALFVAIRHIRRSMTHITVTTDRLRYETGFLSKMMHAVELVKVQDVRVDQSVWQRMIDVGDLSIETAGGSSRIEMTSVDNPHKVAEQILALAQSAR